MWNTSKDISIEQLMFSKRIRNENHFSFVHNFIKMHYQRHTIVTDFPKLDPHQQGKIKTRILEIKITLKNEIPYRYWWLKFIIIYKQYR